MTMRLKRGDTVQVISGAHRGKKGKVLRVDRGDAPGSAPVQVIVQGVNLCYKHIRRSQKYPQGGRIQKEAPLDVSKVMLFDAAESRPVRTRAGADKSGAKIRVSTRSGKPV